jgi:group II intron reverse transcriptase/maturase
MRIAQLAVEAPTMVFTTLAHHIDMDWLLEAYRRTRKDGAVGVDGQSAQEYGANLEANLGSLLERFKSGRYFAPPVRRVHIPKGNGKETRPIGIPAFEDKVLQRAVVMVLEPIYEQDFLPCSYGFRPGRSAHQALQAFWQQAMKMKGGWVLEIDIRKFFDTLGHERLREIIRHRIGDGVLLRTIGKWLNAGVQEAGCVSYPTEGSPQGGVISPLLANAYLHEVLDAWFEDTVKPRLQGAAELIRYADDAVMLFKEERDARRVLDVLPKRFGKYGLTLHPEKTRLVPFQRPRRRDSRDADDRPGTFDLLGFKHFWGRSRKGNWVVKRKTTHTRMTRALRALNMWCRRNRHLPVKQQWRILWRKLTGHYAYYGIPGNTRTLSRFGYWAMKAWHKWLCRRSQRAYMKWEVFLRLLVRYPLPTPTLRHPSAPLANA